jgi:hypothetical protein
MNKGSNNQFDFEENLHARLRCETHTFDPTVEENKAQAHVTTFHQLGLVMEAKSDRQRFLSIGQTLDLLAHANRTIDIFKIDCEGCEYSLFDQGFFDALRVRSVKV